MVEYAAIDPWPPPPILATRPRGCAARRSSNSCACGSIDGLRRSREPPAPRCLVPHPRPPLPPSWQATEAQQQFMPLRQQRWPSAFSGTTCAPKPCTTSQAGAGGGPANLSSTPQQDLWSRWQLVPVPPTYTPRSDMSSTPQQSLWQSNPIKWVWQCANDYMLNM